MQDHRLRRGVPVNCFYKGENMLVIHPDECIDCGVCVPECPVDAIKPDTEPGLAKWLELYREYAQKWPNITIKKPRAKRSPGTLLLSGGLMKLQEYQLLARGYTWGLAPIP